MTRAEFLRQYREAKLRDEEEERTAPRAVSALYNRWTGMVEVHLRNGSFHAFPAELAQGLRGAPPELLEQVEVTPSGDGLHWEALDADVHVEFLLAGVYGTRRWMAELGRAGGSVRSEAKAAAARANGMKGGRPRKDAAKKAAPKRPARKKPASQAGRRDAGTAPLTRAGGRGDVDEVGASEPHDALSRHGHRPPGRVSIHPTRDAGMNTPGDALDVDVLFATGHFLRPDLVFVPADRRGGISDRGIEVPPALVVEVQSPTSKTIEHVKKRRRYGDFGIPEYWVLDPVEGAAFIWRFAAGATEPARVVGRFQWHPPGAPGPLALDTAELLRQL
jgi:hypothetical protein